MKYSVIHQVTLLIEQEVEGESAEAAVEWAAANVELDNVLEVLDTEFVSADPVEES